MPQVKLKISVRTDFLVRTASGSVEFHWSPGEPVAKANVWIQASDGSTEMQGVTNNIGVIELLTNDLPDGDHVVRLTHEDPPPSITTDETGPLIGDPLPDPPPRIYKPIEFGISTTGGRMTNVTDPYDPASGVVHGRMGNRALHNWSASHLPIDWRPVWMRSPREREARDSGDITLIVVHRTAGRILTGALNTFLNPLGQTGPNDVAAAHYIINLDGHIIKMGRDKHRFNHVGAPAKWGGNSMVNAMSIGIEVVNGDPDSFTEEQYTALLALLERLQSNSEYGILSHRVVGHGDADGSGYDKTGHTRRENDPGRHFEWERLERQGLGMIPQANVDLGNYYGGFFSNIAGGVLRRDDRDAAGSVANRYGGVTRADIPIPGANPPMSELQQDLGHIGYWVDMNGRYDERTQLAVDKFQRHFFSGSRRNEIPDSALGKVDAKTANWIKIVRAGVP